MSQTSLDFILILLGLVLNILPRFYDQHIFVNYKRKTRNITPDTKNRSFAIACPALEIVLWRFCWTIPLLVTHFKWAVSMIGLVLVDFAANDFAYISFGYITDLYSEYAASDVASLSLSRTLVAAVFPLLTTQMYKALGANVATTILALIATLFALTPILFLKYTLKPRAMSKYGSESKDGQEGKVSDIEKGEKEENTTER
jgi:hypothetical protein